MNGKARMLIRTTIASLSVAAVAALAVSAQAAPRPASAPATRKAALVTTTVKVTTFNFELAYHFDYPASKPWNVYAGGGPALVLEDSHGNHHTGGGFNFLVGIQSREGLFGEVKAGVMDSPNFKVVIGYVFHY